MTSLVVLRKKSWLVRNEPKSIGLGLDIGLFGLGLGLELLNFGLILVICGLYNKADKNKTINRFFFKMLPYGI